MSQQGLLICLKVSLKWGFGQGLYIAGQPGAEAQYQVTTAKELALKGGNEGDPLSP